MEWFTLNVMRTLIKCEMSEDGDEDGTHLYSTPSLMMMGFFLVSASLALSARLKTIFFPGGSVGDSSSRVRTVT